MLSIGGRVSAYLFDVKFVEKNITACGAYFDNKLFMMYFPERELIAQDVRSLFSAGLEREYGKGEVFGGGDIYITQWVDQSNSVDIQDTLPGGINYLFSPVKLEQLKTWVDFYDGKLSDQIGDSDL